MASRAAQELFGDLAPPSVGLDRGPDSRTPVGDDLRSLADAAAERHGIDPRFFRGLIQTESSWNPSAVSSKGALGLGQVMPGTGRDMGYSVDQLQSVEGNLDASAKYLGQMLDAANGDHELAARMYNAGPAGNLNNPDVVAYGRKVFTNAGRYNDTGSTPDLFRGVSDAVSNFRNDATTGLSGYSSASQGFDSEAADNFARYRARQAEINQNTRPQDQSFTEAMRGGPAEFFGDYLPYTIGSAVGSSAPGLAGAAAGFAVGGPVGAAVGLALPLLAQYLGNTWAENTASRMEAKGINPDTATPDQVYRHSGLTPSQWMRVTGAALGRAGLEGAGDVLLGGLGGKVAAKLLPKGAATQATNLLEGTAARRITSAGLGEGITEMGDVPLSDIGSGRPWSGPQDYLDAFAGGVIGGAGARGGYEAASNPKESLGAIQSGISNAVNNTAWGQERAARKDAERMDRIRGDIATGAQKQADLEAQMQTEAEARAAAEAEAEAERNRIPSVEELHAELIADWQADADRRKPAKVTEQEYHKAVDDLVARGLSPDQVEADYPHLVDFAAFKKWTTAKQKAASKEEVAPRKPTRLDAIRYRQAIEQQRSGGETGTPNIQFSPELSIGRQSSGWKDSPDNRASARWKARTYASQNGLFRNQLTDMSVEGALDRAAQATTPEEQEAWINTAIAREQVRKQEANDPTPVPTYQEMQERLRQQQGQVDSAMQAAAGEEARRGELSTDRNQAYDLLDEQQAAQKESDFAAMERQRQLADAQQQIAESNRVTPDQALINGKRAPTQFKTRPSVVVAENIAALEAQNTEATKHNTFASKVEEAKRNMLAKAIAALRKQGALIEDGDQLQWASNKWSLYPPNYRGRPPTGYFYADIFNAEGKKIGKVLRPSRPTPPTPPEETTDVQENTGGDAKDGKQQGREKKPRRKATRRVSVSEAQGQSEANDAAQGSEVDADAQALIDLVARQQEEKKAAEARKRKDEEDEAMAIARDEAFDEDAGFDYFNKSGRQQGANEVKKFLTKKSLAEQKKNPTTVRDILQHYLDTAPEGGYQGLAQALLNIPGVATAPISFTVADEEGDLGVYRTSKGVIEIHDGGGWHTVFHEAVHAATVKGYVTDKKLRAAMDRLYAQVKVRAKRDGKEEQYGFTNALEFMSEALTNPEFQDYLSSIDFDENQNFWGRMVEAIRNFLQQFSPSNAPLGNALDAAIRVTTVAMQQTSAAGDIRVEDSALDAVLKNKAADAFTAYTDKLMDTSLGDVAGAARDTFNKLIVSANNTAFLAKWRPDLESLQKIHAAETKMQASQGKNANAVMDKVDDIRNLEKPERTKLFTLMVDSTRARMHPDRPLDDKTNAHIPNTPENEVLHRDLAARFNALTPDARKAYQETRDLFQKMFEQRTKALFALSERLLTEKKQEQFKENINRLSKEMPGPYFPLARFGNYVSVWKSKDYAKAQKENDTTAMERLKRDPEHYVVSFHSSQAQASRALKKMIAKMGDRSALGTTEKVDGEKVDTKMHFSYALERNAYDGGVTMDLRPLLEKMQSAVETTVGAENSKGAKDALAEIFIASLSDTNVLKSALKRENIEGVKPEEMLRAVAKHGSAQAFHISRLEHMADIQDALKELRAEDSMAINKGERFSVYNTVAGALTGMYTGDPNTVAARAVNATNFLLYNGRLALNPAFWLTNAMAPLVVSVPYMRGRFKLNAVMDEYRSSFVDAVKVVLPKGLKDATRFSLLDAIENAKDLSAGERKMLLSLMDEGLIDENQIRELSNVAEGDIGVKDNLARYLGAIPHRVEALNRVSTALTAYRLQLGRDKDADAAIRYAMEATAETQVNYTTAGTPYLLRKNGWLGAPAAKLFTQFVRYQLGMVQLIGHNFREAFGSKKVDAKTREEARRKFYALLTMHTAMSGASGLFGASAFMAVAQGITNLFRDDDDEVDLEREMRKLSDDIFGKELSRGVRKGVPAMFGFDLSSRLGMGDMLSLRRENPFKGDAGEIKSKLVDDLSPSVSNLINWYDWFQKGFPMKKIPISLVANLAKASELYGKGMVSAHGIVKKGPEDYNAADITLQGLGFTPTESSDAFAEQSSVRAKEKAITASRESLIDAWNNAMADNDKEGVADARRKILEFNARHSNKRDFQITPDTLTKSRKQRLARQKRMNDAGVFIPKRGEWRNQ